MKKVIIIVASVFVFVGALVGGILGYRAHKRNSNPVKVYSMTNFVEYYGWDSDSMDGSVSYEDEQNVIVATDKTVKEVHVKQGQNVKTGDPLLTYDATIYQLKINTVRADINLNNARIEAANRKLTKLKNTKPVERKDEEDTEAPTTEEPTTERATVWIPSPSDADPQTYVPVYADDGTPYVEPDPDDIPDDFPDDPGEGGEPEVTYTKEELASEIRNTNDRIRDLKLSNQTLALQIKKYQKDIENCTVVAKMDGVVTSVDITEETIGMGNPVIQIKGSGQSIVKVDVSEWALGNVSVGDEVYVTSYDDGMQYTGKVIELSTSPSNYSSYGYEVKSYYPMSVAVIDENEMDSSTWVQVSFSADSMSDDDSDGTLALPLFMVKEENGNYYVMKEEDGKLVKQYVKTGKIYWGSEIEIKGGLTTEDFIAFPYSKNAVPDRKCVETDSIDDLYY